LAFRHDSVDRTDLVRKNGQRVTDLDLRERDVCSSGDDADASLNLMPS
jgi:hypothetical protein